MIEALISYWINVQAGQLTYFVGSHVWVEDPDEVWIDGEILESKDDEITISYESGKKVSKPLGTYVYRQYIVWYSCLRDS